MLWQVRRGLDQLLLQVVHLLALHHTRGPPAHVCSFV